MKGIKQLKNFLHLSSGESSTSSHFFQKAKYPLLFSGIAGIAYYAYNNQGKVEKGSTLKLDSSLPIPIMSLENSIHEKKNLSGSNNVELGTEYLKLGDLYKSYGMNVKARESYQNSADIIAKFRGQDHPEVVLIKRKMDSVPKVDPKITSEL